MEYPNAPTSILEAARPLITPGGAVTIADAAEHDISSGPTVNSYLRRIEGVCTVAGTTAGTISLRRKNGGAVYLIFNEPVAPPIGTRRSFIFDSPIPADGEGAAFSLQFSVATLGTWVFYVNGFCWK